MGHKDLKYYSITVWYMYRHQNTKQIKLSTSDILGHGTVQIHHGPSFEKISFSLLVKSFLWKLPFPQNFKCSLGLKSDSKLSELNKKKLIMFLNSL